MLESLIGKLADNGPLAIVLCLTIIAAVKLWTELKQSWIERIAEQKQLTPVLDATAKSNLSIGVAMENRNQAIEALGKAQEATVREVSIVARDLDRHIASQAQRDEIERQRWERVERMLTAQQARSGGTP